MKHMKKNDGYVMVYVLIVFTVLSLVAASICGVALKNLQAQEATIDRMQARYEAEGYLQEFIAKIELLRASGTAGPSSPVDGLEGSAKAAMQQDFFAKVKQLDEMEDFAQLKLLDGSTFDCLIIQTTSEDDTVQIVAKIQIELESTSNTTTMGEGVGLQYTCTCETTTVKVVAYDSYDISYQTADNTESGGEEVPDET